MSDECRRGRQRGISRCREREKEKNSWRTVAETRKERERKNIGVGQMKAREESAPRLTYMYASEGGSEEEEMVG